MKNHVQSTIAAIACAAALLGSTSAWAAPALYATPGVHNAPSYVFTAAADGDARAYFTGSAASYVGEVGLLVNGVDTGHYGLNNHGAAYGDAFDFGHVNAGDTLVLVLRNLTPGDIAPWYSQRSLNADGVNHVYASAYAGDELVPAGTYVAFEDLPGGGDFNYNDHSVVLTNVSVTTAVPEPGVALMLGVGAAGLLLARRRQA